MAAFPRLVMTYLLCLTFVSSSFAYDFAARSLAEKVERANQNFEKGKVDEALKGYTDAQLSSPDSPKLQHNIGAVHYRKGAFDEAVKAFEGALLNEDRKEKAASFYNLGNTYYRQGAQKGDMELFKKLSRSTRKLSR